MHPKMTCDRQRVENFLRNQLDADETKEFEAHLDQCDVCQTLLTDAAGGADWWEEASEFLQDQAGDYDHHDNEVLPDIISFLNPTENPRMLGRFGGYEIAGVIGQGGMGVVLKGFDESLNRYVAIKVLAPQLATRGSARNRFARESKAAAAVVHDNVIAIHGVSENAGLPYLIMPYVRGESLQKLIDRAGPLTPIEVIRVAHQVACGLAAAHAQGLVHRDIKPANILLPVGVQRVLITDFGLARAVDDSNLTGTGTIAGTPEFMSPEQALGESVDIRSDLFSLGTVMYAMCTGRSPFRASNSFGVLRRIVDDTPRSIRDVNSSIPDWLEHVIRKLHAKQPNKRYQSAAELANVLEQCLAHLQTPKSALPAELAALARRPKRWQWAIPTVVASLALALIITWNPWQSASQQQQSPDSSGSPNLVQEENDQDQSELDQLEKKLAKVSTAALPELTPAYVLRGHWELESIQHAGEVLSRRDLVKYQQAVSAGETVTNPPRIGPLAADIRCKDNEMEFQDVVNGNRLFVKEFKVDASQGPRKKPRQMRLIQSDNNEVLNLICDYQVSYGFANRLTVVACDDNQFADRFGSREKGEYLYVFRRPETEPLALRNQVEQIKQIIVEHVKKQNRSAYAFCEHLLKLAESYEREASLRQRILSLNNESKELQARGEHALSHEKTKLMQQLIAQGMRESNSRLELERLRQDQQKTQQQIGRLIDRITALQKEGNYEGAKATKTELLSLLRSNDGDYDKLNRLRHRMVQQRLAGNHESANRIMLEIESIEKLLKIRYGDVDQREERRRIFDKAYRLHVEWFVRNKKGETVVAEKSLKQLEQLKQTVSERYGSDALLELENDLETVLKSIPEPQQKKKKRNK